MFLLTLAMILVISPRVMAQGEVFVADHFAYLSGGNLVLIDEVSGGCLPEPNAAKNAAEVEFRRSGFGLSVEGVDIAKIEIFFHGFEVSSAYCVAKFRLELWGRVARNPDVKWVKNLRTSIPNLIYRDGGLIAGPKSDFQKQIEEVSAQLARTFTLEWLRLRQDVERRARTGDPEAMFEYANHLRSGADLERLKWYCLAAHGGHAKARYRLGDYFTYGPGYGLGAVEEDVVLAYVWYTLSFEAGWVGDRDWFSRDMTSTQISEAEQLVAEWEPNPTECDEIAAKAGKL